MIPDGTGIENYMDTTIRFERCQSFRVDAEAWRHPDVVWESEDLIEFAAATARCDSLSQLVPESLARMFPEDGLRSWAVIMIDADGGIRRGPDDATDPGLRARAVTWLWTSGTIADALGDGAAYVETWHTERGAEAVACLPLMRDGVVRSLVAVRFIADSTDAILRDVSRLTLLGHLWMDSQAWGLDPAEPGHQMSGSELAELTTRQIIILRAMARGLTNGQIAQQISFSESTVRLESMCIYRHFGVHSRAEAVQAARAAGEL